MLIAWGFAGTDTERGIAAMLFARRCSRAPDAIAIDGCEIDEAERCRLERRSPGARISIAPLSSREDNSISTNPPRITLTSPDRVTALAWTDACSICIREARRSDVRGGLRKLSRRHDGSSTYDRALTPAKSVAPVRRPPSARRPAPSLVRLQTPPRRRSRHSPPPPRSPTESRSRSPPSRPRPTRRR